MNLRYKSGVMVEELAIGDCCIHRVSGSDGKPAYWHLWFYVAREDNGAPETFAVPIIPRGAYTETGPGGRSWGFTDQGGGTWQISPSINVVNLDATGHEVVAGPNAHQQSIWHQTPAVIGVPTGEPWQ
jgi:hypothetical protein